PDGHPPRALVRGAGCPALGRAALHDPGHGRRPAAAAAGVAVGGAAALPGGGHSRHALEQPGVRDPVGGELWSPTFADRAPGPVWAAGAGAGERLAEMALAAAPRPSCGVAGQFGPVGGVVPFVMTFPGTKRHDSLSFP